MNNAIFRNLAFLCVPVFFTACVSSSSGGGNLQNIVNQQGQAIQQLQGQLSGMQPAQADSWSQVQALRQELAQIKGELDNLQNATASMGGISQVGNVLAKHNQALEVLETQLALDFDLDAPVSTVGTMPNTATSNNNPYTNQGAITNPTQTTGQATITNPTASQGTTTPTNQGGLDTAQALYDSGILNFNNRNYANALNSFVDFAKVYPTHALVSNAYFWEGESNYQLKNYAAAALAYEKVISKYPNSNKAPASYLKQGMAFAALGKADAAKERLNSLIKNYPKAAETNRAKQVLQSL